MAQNNVKFTTINCCNKIQPLINNENNTGFLAEYITKQNDSYEC